MKLLLNLRSGEVTEFIQAMERRLHHLENKSKRGNKKEEIALLLQLYITITSDNSLSGSHIVKQDINCLIENQQMVRKKI